MKTVRENTPVHLPLAQDTPLLPLAFHQVHSVPSVTEWGGIRGVVAWMFWVSFLTLHASHTFPLLLRRSSMAAVPLGIPAVVAWSTSSHPSPLVPSPKGCFSHWFSSLISACAAVFFLS